MLTSSITVFFHVEDDTCLKLLESKAEGCFIHSSNQLREFLNTGLET